MDKVSVFKGHRQGRARLTIKMKKAKARRASCESLIEIRMTSIVLQSAKSVGRSSVSCRKRQESVRENSQDDGVRVPERPKDPQESKCPEDREPEEDGRVRVHEQLDVVLRAQEMMVRSARDIDRRTRD